MREGIIFKRSVGVAFVQWLKPSENPTETSESLQKNCFSENTLQTGLKLERNEKRRLSKSQDSAERMQDSATSQLKHVHSYKRAIG